MGKIKEKTPVKSEKASLTKQEQINIHLYPDWPAIQAYYGPGVPSLPAHFNSAVTAGHVPQPYVWGPPQPLMPPYGMPYTTICSHGGVYAHSAFPLVPTPAGADAPPKSLGIMDQGLTKKLKRVDGPTVSVGNESAKGDGSVRVVSPSVEQGIDGSSDGSNGNTGVHQLQRKGGSKDKFSTGNDTKIHPLPSPMPEGKKIAAYDIAVASASVSEKSVGLGHRNGTTEISVPHVGSTAGALLPSEVWVQGERQLKRERRKQANRESARRSRLRKQAENEALMMNYESLNVENMALKSEINQLTEDSEKLRLENAALKDKLKNAELGSPREMVSDQMKTS